MSSIKTIGIIGGGQLGKMLAMSAQQMGFRVATLDPSADAPAKSVSHTFIEAPFSDKDALIDLCEQSDVITYEFENIDGEILNHLTEHYHIPQGAETVLTLQNRTSEKAAIKNSGATVVPYESVQSNEDIESFANTHDYPVIVKTDSGGYDGKGQYFIDSEEALQSVNIPFDDADFIVEKYIDLKAEVSLTVGRNTKGQTVFFPLQENLHIDQILYRTTVPSRFNYQEQASIEAEKIMEALHFVGVFTIEFFIDKNDNLYVNEIAPRPHNSAHHSIESCNYSQFDIHIRAVLGKKLPEIELRTPALMMNLLGKDLTNIGENLYNQDNWHVHVYGKTENKPERKMGHVTVLTQDISRSLHELRPFFKSATDNY